MSIARLLNDLDEYTNRDLEQAIAQMETDAEVLLERARTVRHILKGRLGTKDAPVQVNQSSTVVVQQTALHIAATPPPITQEPPPAEKKRTRRTQAQMDAMASQVAVFLEFSGPTKLNVIAKETGVHEVTLSKLFSEDRRFVRTSQGVYGLNKLPALPSHLQGVADG